MLWGMYKFDRAFFCLYAFLCLTIFFSLRQKGVVMCDIVFLFASQERGYV